MIDMSRATRTHTSTRKRDRERPKYTAKDVLGPRPTFRGGLKAWRGAHRLHRQYRAWHAQYGCKDCQRKIAEAAHDH